MFSLLQQAELDQQLKELKF